MHGCPSRAGEPRSDADVVGAFERTALLLSLTEMLSLNSHCLLAPYGSGTLSARMDDGGFHPCGYSTRGNLQRTTASFVNPVTGLVCRTKGVCYLPSMRALHAKEA